MRRRKRRRICFTDLRFRIGDLRIRINKFSIGVINFHKRFVFSMVDSHMSPHIIRSRIFFLTHRARC